MEDLQSTIEVKTEVLDCEFVELDPQDVSQVCMGCLCATRTTHTLKDDKLKQYYMHILTEMQPEGGVVLQSPRVCWECVSHLKRSVRFREQVQDSYRLLQPMLSMCGKEDLDEFLQSTVRCLGRLETCLAFSIDISPQDDDTQVMTVTKHDDYDDEAALENGCEKHSSTLTSGKKVDSGKKPFQCEMCHKIIKRKGDLILHMRIHTGEKPFQCEVCHKSFSKTSNLYTHKRIHTGEKPFQCEVCPKSFAVRNCLIMHMKRHAGEKPFQCKVCLKSFADRSNLNTHKRIHTGEKPFKCEVCHKSFAFLGSLNNHKRIHTGEKPFQCKVCHKSFARTGDLSRHNRRHTGE